MIATTLSACILAAALGQAPAENGLPDSAGQLSFGHVWSDSGGRVSGAAALVDYDDETVVLKKPSGKLAVVPIARLSTADRQYLRSQATLAAIQALTNRDHVWRLLDGTKLIGQARDFSHQKLVVQRRQGGMWVNGKPFKALTELQQYMVLKTIEHFDGTPLPDAAALNNWGAKQRGQPRQFSSEAVLLELQDSQQATVPFFLFGLDDQQYLRPGWEALAGRRAESGKRGPNLHRPRPACAATGGPGAAGIGPPVRTRPLGQLAARADGRGSGPDRRVADLLVSQAPRHGPALHDRHPRTG